MSYILETKNIKRSFPVASGTVTVLKGLDMQVPEKSLTILKGRSGSGKTTLLNILSALDMPTSGTILFQGRDIGKKKKKERELIRRKQMGFIFQAVALVPVMSAAENVEFALRMAGKTENTAKRIEECLHRVGLWKRKDHMPGQLSGGEQQRVAIARAIAHRPQIIFADEPTGALDTENGILVVKLFRELVAQEGITVVMTTHDPGLMELGDVIYEMEDGEWIGR